MFSSPNVTGGFGTLGTPNPQQSTLGLPNSLPAISMQSNVNMPNAYASISGIVLPTSGSTSSPGFTFNANTPASLQGQLPLSLAGTYGMNNASNTPNTGSGMLGVPSGMGFTRGAGTPGAQSVSGQSQGQARKQAGADEGGLSIDAALKGLEEAMAAVVKMEELLMGIKADQERVFGGKGTLPSNLSGSQVMTKAEGMGVVEQAGDAGPGQGDAGMNQVEIRQGPDQGVAGSDADAVGGMQDTVVLQRLQQSRLEYSQLQQALQQHLLSTTLGSLPLHHHHHASPPTTSDPPAPDATTSDGNANATAVPGQEQAMSVVELISWAEARAERDFGQREGVKEGARVVLDALKLR